MVTNIYHTDEVYIDVVLLYQFNTMLQKFTKCI